MKNRVLGKRKLNHWVLGERKTDCWALSEREPDRGSLGVRSDDRGLSLVEVIIAVAIMSIILLATLQLVMSGTRMYKKTSENVDAQTEAQLLENQLNNLIVDAECSVFAYDSAGGAPVPDTSGFQAPAYIKVFNTEVAYYIAWDQAQSKVYYLEKPVADGSVAELSDAEKSGFGSWYLMGEGVVAFCPDSSHVGEQQRLVSVELRVEKGEGNYETVQNISLRNNVLESNNPGEIYSGEEPERDDAVTSVQVSPQAVPVNRGGTMEFHALVKSGGNVAASQEVTWKVSGAGSAGTTISDAGVLTVAPDETSAIISVTATAKGTGIFGQTSVIVPAVSSVIVSASSNTPQPGSVVRFTAQVGGLNLNNEAREVLWSVEPAVSGVSISDGGVLSVGSSVTPGTVITVKATVRVTASDASPVSGICTVTVAEAGEGIPHIVTGTDQYVLNRNGSLALSISGGNQNVTWSLVNDGGLGGKISISPSGVLTAARDIDFSASYTITVKAVPIGGGEAEAMTQTITIEPVSIVFSGAESYSIAPGSIGRFPYELKGLESTGTDLSVSSAPSFSSQSGTFLYCTSSELVVVLGRDVAVPQITVTASLIDNATVRDTVTIQVITPAP